ncbi:TyeA family type III secretion system gatekeeper subunit [Dyella sp. M7H15-1]|uniref:TyeA family type III secretion system gatekeeper subunit n=1 Tax=Dyella sp. M7H15-1 TaxID=2501295 RepID=UPI0010050674|nr:TyeA family type III secretion system gatekeeper subunit [Dyella sp. M7H15-1]QAU24827.1 TyeA family type III secretion system gatekeeper subunit [Dyella sp. M7H15-1]
MFKLDQVNLRGLAELNDLGTQTAGNTHLPAESTTAIARSSLLEFQSNALAETQEDLGFALGGRLRDTRRGGPGTQQNVRGRVLAHKLVAEIESVGAITLDALLDSPDDWQQSPHLLTALQQQAPDPGQAALLLAATLARGKPNGLLRRRMQDALAELAADDDMSLSLFGTLEFGVCTPGLMHELRRLYHRASAQHQKMSQWLATLGERDERQRKLRTMLRVLSYELSASGQPIVGSHLAAVIDDLQQLLRIIGLEAHCDQAADALALPAFNGETMLRHIVELIEQIWLTPEAIADIVPDADDDQRYKVVQALLRLIQLLPDECFNDTGHRTQIIETLTEYRNTLAE